MLKELAFGLLAGVASCTAAHAGNIEHVLLISVDGLHALDVARSIESHPNSALAKLSRHGVTYSNARFQRTTAVPSAAEVPDRTLRRT